MELDFDDIDIPISDARLSHLSPTVPHVLPVGSTSIVTKKAGGRNGPGSKGKRNAANVHHHHHQHEDVLDLDDGLSVDEDEGMEDPAGMMDWQSIEAGGQFIPRARTHLPLSLWI